MTRPKNPCRTNFEANLIALMADAHIDDYSALAAKAETTQATLQRICSGKVKPSIETLQKLAAALNCKVDDLIVTEP